MREVGPGCSERSFAPVSGAGGSRFQNHVGRPLAGNAGGSMGAFSTIGPGDKRLPAFAESWFSFHITVATLSLPA
jgi:hypothetical protein